MERNLKFGIQFSNIWKRVHRMPAAPPPSHLEIFEPTETYIRTLLPCETKLK